MATADIGTDGTMVHNVGTDLLAEIRLDLHVREEGRELVDLGFGQIGNLAGLVDRQCCKDLQGRLLSDAIEQREGVLLW